MGNNGRFREEHETEFTDHDFVAVLQRRLINTLTVHVGAVQTSCINHKELTGQFFVVDAGSLNGTYVNRQRVDQAALKNGDEIMIGKFRLVFFTKSAIIPQ